VSYQYSAALQTPYPTQAGVRYWLSIVSREQLQWIWEVSDSTLNPGVQRMWGGGNWEPYFDNTAFALNGDTLPDLRLLSPVVQSSQIQLCWPTITNAVYQLQYCSDPWTNRWFSLGTPITGNGSRFCTNDSVPAGNLHRFYRLTLVDPNTNGCGLCNSAMESLRD
jgi:hypothetical protein